MEGLRILDEWSLLEGRFTLDTVFKRKAEAVTELSKEEQEILLLVDGETDLSTIIDISGKDGFTAAKILFSLMEKGIVEPQEAVPVIEEPIKEVKEAKISDSSLYTVALAVAITISVVISISTGLFFSGDAMKKFRASKTVEALRLKIEAYRFERGDYPATIDIVSNQLDPWKRRYIYKCSMDTFIIMSTGADGKEGTIDDVF
jgi:hypothetical protein